MTHIPASVNYRPLNAPPRLHKGVVEQIVAQIMSGALAPGAFLPSEATLAQQFGVSRTVIREAVRVLAGKGLIAVKHGSGMQVEPPERWNYLDPLILFEHLRVSQDETMLNDLLELRRVVEIEVAALAAQRRTEEELRTLREYVEKMRALLNDPHAYTRQDIAFHETILVAAHNRLLAQALRPVSLVLPVGRMISSQRPGGPTASNRGHEEILAALESGDQEQARAAMRRHIMQFEDDIHTILAQGFASHVTDPANEFVNEQGVL